MFLDYFNRFKSHNIINIDVAESLKNLVLDIDKFVDSCQIVNGSSLSSRDIAKDFKNNNIQLFPIYSCGTCNGKQVTGKNILEHLNSESHLMRKNLRENMARVDAEKSCVSDEITSKLAKTSLNGSNTKLVAQKPAISDKYILPFIPTSSKTKSQVLNGKDFKDLSLDELLQFSKMSKNSQNDQPEATTSQAATKDQKPPQQKPTEQKKSKQQKQEQVAKREPKRKDPSIALTKFLKDNNLDNYVERKITEGGQIKKSKATKEVISTLTEILKDRYPDITLNPFGSRVNGLGITGSDLDVFVDLGRSDIICVSSVVTKFLIFQKIICIMILSTKCTMKLQKSRL